MTPEEKLARCKNLYRHAVVVETEESVFNAFLVSVAVFPEPKIRIRYAIADEELGCTQLIEREIMVSNVKQISSLASVLDGFKPRL